jgi:rubredoxin
MIAPAHDAYSSAVVINDDLQELDSILKQIQEVLDSETGYKRLAALSAILCQRVTNIQYWSFDLAKALKPLSEIEDDEPIQEGDYKFCCPVCGADKLIEHSIRPVSAAVRNIHVFADEHVGVQSSQDELHVADYPEDIEVKRFSCENCDYSWDSAKELLTTNAIVKQ